MGVSEWRATTAGDNWVGLDYDDEREVGGTGMVTGQAAVWKHQALRAHYRALVARGLASRRGGRG